MCQSVWRSKTGQNPLTECKYAGQVPSVEVLITWVEMKIFIVWRMESLASKRQSHCSFLYAYVQSHCSSTAFIGFVNEPTC
jgi:hypothetical protein